MLSKQVQQQGRELWDFSQLQLSLRAIRILNRAPTVRFVSRLYLDGNHLLSLSGIEQFLNLEVLHFDYNYVSLPSQLAKVANPFFMRELSFIANPIQSHHELTIDRLKQVKFTRLAVLNPYHRLSKHNPSEKKKKKDREPKSVNPEETERRKPKYTGLQGYTSRRTMAGMIYTTKQRSKNRAVHSKDTRESTGKPSIADSPVDTTIPREGEGVIGAFQQGDYLEKNQFYRQNKGGSHRDSQRMIYRESQRERQDESQRNSQRDSNTNNQKNQSQNLIEREGSAMTARFEQSGGQVRLGEQFLAQQKQRLAAYFHKRGVMQKCFSRLRNSNYTDPAQQSSQNLEQYSGQLLNNHLQTLRFGLIKLWSGRLS